MAVVNARKPVVEFSVRYHDLQETLGVENADSRSASVEAEVSFTSADSGKKPWKGTDKVGIKHRARSKAAAMTEGDKNERSATHGKPKLTDPTLWSLRK